MFVTFFFTLIIFLTHRVWALKSSEERHETEWKTINECASSKENALGIPSAVFLSISVVGTLLGCFRFLVAFFVCLFFGSLPHLDSLSCSIMLLLIWIFSVLSCLNYSKLRHSWHHFLKLIPEYFVSVKQSKPCRIIGNVIADLNLNDCLCI